MYANDTHHSHNPCKPAAVVYIFAKLILIQLDFCLTTHIDLYHAGKAGLRDLLEQKKMLLEKPITTASTLHYVAWLENNS